MWPYQQAQFEEQALASSPYHLCSFIKHNGSPDFGSLRHQLRDSHWKISRYQHGDVAILFISQPGATLLNPGTMFRFLDGMDTEHDSHSYRVK